ncbi:magnesium-chelatase subunit chlh-like protein chloroplast precursor [Dorcoceras hygrometricum]|uniref:Magnesium-chelatase subunit chlh-like protein chloroplast n=1 Tax=Dorcoceras hygrometricum TaxID=472368 RepID=A0A2Z7AC49_9LAMI|nr:magnesium-chelatase subunit chlh-like protein chloroplast precursor [Dorcoceras hygrometricum]
MAEHAEPLGLLGLNGAGDDLVDEYVPTGGDSADDLIPTGAHTATLDPWRYNSNISAHRLSTAKHNKVPTYQLAPDLVKIISSHYNTLDQIL